MNSKSPPADIQELLRRVAAGDNEAGEWLLDAIVSMISRVQRLSEGAARDRSSVNSLARKIVAQAQKGAIRAASPEEFRSYLMTAYRRRQIVTLGWPGWFCG